jgi:ATP-dependent DNA ligase
VPVPGFVAPMQAMLVDSIRPGDWIYEIKFDGNRALALRGGSGNATPKIGTKTIWLTYFKSFIKGAQA